MEERLEEVPTRSSLRSSADYLEFHIISLKVVCSKFNNVDQQYQLKLGKCAIEIVYLIRIDQM